MATTNPSEGELVPLYGLRFTPDNLIVWASSTGCTSAKDFKVGFREAAPGQSGRELEIRRINPDLCRAAEHPVELRFPWDEVFAGPGPKSLPVRVANRFGVLPTLF